MSPKAKKVAAIVAVLRAEGWTEIRGTEWMRDPNNHFAKVVVSHNELLAMVHPRTKLGFCTCLNKLNRYGNGRQAGFYQVNTKKGPTHSYPNSPDIHLTPPLRKYTIGPITGLVIDTLNKVITNKEGCVAVSYGI
jgi:hypothetical protein